MRIAQHRAPVLPVPASTRAATLARPGGIHVSSLIKRICQALEPARFGASGQSTSSAKDVDIDLDAEPRIWLGQAVDAYMKDTLAAEGASPVESLEVDGIVLSSDLVWLTATEARAGFPDENADDLIVDEIKLTWMSVRQPITDKKFRHWLWQLMAYCWAWETLRGRLRVFAVNGDYAPPSPRYDVYDFLFTYQELDDNWRMLKGHRPR